MNILVIISKIKKLHLSLESTKMKKSILKNDYLFNMVLPLILWEWWYVLLAFIIIVFIETYIVKFYTKVDFLKLFNIFIVANLITTIGGYLAQGILRVIIGGFLYTVPKVNFDSYPVVEGILGNVAIGKEYIPKFTTEVISTIATSIIITFTLSVIIERKYVLKNIKPSIDISLTSKGVIVANVISYTLLTIWICYNYLKIDE